MSLLRMSRLGQREFTLSTITSLYAGSREESVQGCLNQKEMYSTSLS